MGYLDIAKRRMDKVNSSSPVDILIEGSVGSIALVNFYTDNQYTGILVEDKSSNFVDEKILYIKSNDFVEGNIITWDGINWILFQKDHDTVESYDKFYMLECSSKIQFLIDGYKSKEHPVSFLKTSQGMKSTRASSRYIYTEGDSNMTILMNRNSETENLETSNELIINKTVWEIGTINTYESDSILVIELNKVLKSNADDIDMNIADSDNELDGVTYNDGLYDYIIAGDNSISIESSKDYQVFRIDEDGSRDIVNSVVYSVAPELVILSQVNDIATLTAEVDTGSFTLTADFDGNTISKNIEVTNFWG